MSMRARRHGEVSVSNVFFLAACVLALYLAATVLPMYWVKLEMYEVLGIILQEWRLRGEERAKAVFVRELEKREMPEDIQSVCTFYDYRKERSMECWWEEDVYLPFFGPVHTLDFYLYRGVDLETGELFDIEVEDE